MNIETSNFQKNCFFRTEISQVGEKLSLLFAIYGQPFSEQQLTQEEKRAKAWNKARVEMSTFKSK